MRGASAAKGNRSPVRRSRRNRQPGNPDKRPPATSRCRREASASGALTAPCSRAFNLRHGVANRSRTALLLVDVISDFRFEDGERVLRQFRPVAPRLARLKQRARDAGVPAIYANDNFGRWRSDASSLVKRCSRRGAPGAELVRMLAPTPEDYFVLKPRHSAFFASALEALLAYMGARRLIITGLSSHQCVLFTANDAYVREYEIGIPRDCIAAPTAEQTRFALRYFEMVLSADTRSSTRIRDWKPGPAGRRRRRAQGGPAARN